MTLISSIVIMETTLNYYDDSRILVASILHLKIIQQVFGAVVGDVVKSVFEKMQKADGEEEEETAEPEREEAAEEETK